MTDIILAGIRVAMLLLGISVTLALVISVTRYVVGMFAALPALIPMGIIIVILVTAFFLEDIR